ncbi:hypothetical protein [uncultured Sphingomonas sp.]|uniref:hypothetical protein n=1 Tax=uncultured Sphingomonas sp. TaxID=158754 RepID=UPI0035CA67DF
MLMSERGTVVLAGEPSQDVAKSRPRREFLSTWRVFALAFISLFFVMDRRLDPYDEGLMLTAAMSAGAGKLLHRDFYLVYGPGTPWLLSKIWLATTHTFLAARLYGLTIQAGIVALCYHLLKPLIIKWFAVAGVLSAWLWLASAQSFLYPSFPCILLYLLASIAILGGNKDVTSRWRVLAGGVCAGIASLFRYDAGVAILAAEIVYIGVAHLRIDPSERRRYNAAVDLFLLAIGFIVIVGPATLVYFHAGMVEAWWRDVIGSSTSYYRTHRNLPFPTATAILRRPSWISVFLAPIALAVAAATYVTRPVNSSPPTSATPTKQKFGLLMCCLSAALHYKGLVRVEPLHALMSVVPATLLLVLCAAEWWKRPGRRAVLATGSLIILILLPATYAFASTVRRLTSFAGRINIAWLAAGAPPARSSDRPQCLPRDALVGADILPGRLAASDFVREHSSPGEPVFVADNRHDRFTINAVALYYLMDRPPGTRWFIFDPGLQTRSDIQRSIIRDLERAKVRWIVIDDLENFGPEPNASSLSSGVRVLDHWIARSYHRVSYSAPSSVWLQNSASGALGGSRAAQCPPTKD